MKTYWFIFNNTGLFLEKKVDGSYTIPLREKIPTDIAQPSGDIHNITPLNSIKVKTFHTNDTPTNDMYEVCALRASYHKLPLEFYLKAGKCTEILYWDENTKYCGKCGGKMKLHTDISKICEKCGREVWPQLSTAVIVLIHKNDDV